MAKESPPLTEPKSVPADWFERIEKAKQAREQGKLAQQARGKPKPIKSLRD